MAHPMLAMFPSLKGTIERVATVDSAIAQARIRVAIERYRRKQRSHPQSLQDLVPEWLEAVPLHVTSGKQFGYASTVAAFELTVPEVEAR